MVNTNIEWIAMSDQNIINTIGAFIKRKRLEQNNTQMQIAEDAGVNRCTLSQIENGTAISLTSLIQILRALNLLHILDGFSSTPHFSPMALARLEQKERKRARNKSDTQRPESEW